MINLFDPVTIKSTRVRNRVVFPPVVTFWAGDDGVVTDSQVEHYARRAEGGCGLIIVEASCVEKEGRLSTRQLGLWSDAHVRGMARIVEACKAAGAAVLIQIHHAGLKTPPEVTDKPIAPSDYEGAPRPAHGIGFEQLAALRDAFVQAAVRAAAAGADGVELHAAHGYLLNQFSSPIVNTRRDRYGWDLPGRMRLTEEIAAKIRIKIKDAGFVIGCRMGCNEPTLQDGIAIARHLEKLGVDVLHVSSGMGYNRGEAPPEPPEGFPHGWVVWGGLHIAGYVDIPVIAVNGIRTPSDARSVANRGADFVAMARAQLVDPAWSRKAKDRAQPVTCVECKPRCRWFEDGRQCPRFDDSWITPRK